MTKTLYPALPIFAIALSLFGTAQVNGGTQQQSTGSDVFGRICDFEVKFIARKEFSVCRKGGEECTPVSKLKDPVAVGFLEHGDKIYVGPAKAVKHPKGKYLPDPYYPENERQSRKEGQVSLHLVVDSQGAVQCPTVDASPGPAFAESALDTVRKWKFQPATLDGQPVAVVINVSVAFRLH